ncbi:MAG: DUF2004 domain-containing protein [Methylophilaceae bacterium]
MTTLATKYFGEINLEKLDEWYEAELEINQQTVEVSLAISTAATILDKAIIQKIENYVDHLQSNAKAIRQLIQQNFKEKGEAKYYIDSQIEDQDKGDIDDLIENADKTLNKKEKLLSILTLLNIRFYPETEDNMFVVFDYTIDEALTDDLLVVKIYKDDTVRIDIES